jgi:hypothetical protein
MTKIGGENSGRLLEKKTARKMGWRISAKCSEILDSNTPFSVAYPEYFSLAFSAVYRGQSPTIYSGERKRKVFWIGHWPFYSPFRSFKTAFPPVGMIALGIIAWTKLLLPYALMNISLLKED